MKNKTLKSIALFGDTAVIDKLQAHRETRRMAEGNKKLMKFYQSTNWRSESVCKIISELFFQNFFLFIRSPILDNILSYLFPDKDHLKNFCY